MQIHLVIAAVTEDNSRGRDFGGNIQVGTGLIRVLYIFVGDTIVSTPQDATPASADAQASQHENP